jgi:hypothetical protein
MAFLGVTAHWITVKDGKWELRSEIIGMKSVLGRHNGDNLARYFMGLCDRVGICGKGGTKVQLQL